jgi:hypothetical protein
MCFVYIDWGGGWVDLNWVKLNFLSPLSLPHTAPCKMSLNFMQGHKVVECMNTKVVELQECVHNNHMVSLYDPRITL